jgi:hypothetical protein
VSSRTNLFGGGNEGESPRPFRDHKPYRHGEVPRIAFSRVGDNRPRIAEREERETERKGAA